MKVFTYTLFFALAFAGLTSCEPKLDSSSKEAYSASVEKIKASLTPEDVLIFEESLAIVGMDGVDFGSILSGGAESLSEDLLKKMDGLSAEDVFLKAEKIKARIAAEEKEAARKELAELLAKKKRAEADMTELAKFAVTDASFYRTRVSQYLSMTEPGIKLTVTNGTDKAIRKVYFSAKLVSPDRSVPWVDDGFNYEVPGGVEPGETTTWRLSPNIMSDWYNAKTVKGAEMQVAAVTLEGPDGEILYDSAAFSDEESKRVEEIALKYPDLISE